MNICYIIHGFIIGGAEAIVANYLIELKKQGHDVFVIVFSEISSFLTEKLNNASVPIYCLDFDCKNSFLKRLMNVLAHKTNNITSIYDRRLRRLVDAKKPNIIHWHTRINFDSLLNFPVEKQFLTVHADFSRMWNLSNEAYQKKLINLTSNGLNVVVLNDKMREDAKNILSTSNVFQIPNGLNLLEIESNKRNRKDFLSGFGISSRSFVISMVGRFHPIKNQIFTIPIFAEVLKRRPDSYICFVGQEDAIIKDSLLAKIKEYNVPLDHVKFLGLRKDATSILSVSDACIVPSLSESFSLVAVEAQTFGVRTITSDAIPADVLRNKNTFNMSLDDSVDSWADTILGTFVDDTKMKSIDDFAISKVIKQHVALYHESLSKAK